MPPHHLSKRPGSVLFPTLFVVLAFGISWLFWMSEALEPLDLPILRALRPFSSYGAWGPLIAALFVTMLQYGDAGLRVLWQRTITFANMKKWLLLTLFLFPAIVGLPLLILWLSGSVLPLFESWARPWEFPIAFAWIFFLGGPLQEEHGWRGYLLEQLLQRWNAFSASIVVGLVWGAWHIPLFFMPSMQGMYYERPMWGLIVSTTLVSMLFTWLYLRTGKSLLAMLLFHTVFNFSHYLFPMLQSDAASLWYFALLVGAVAFVVVRERELLFRAPAPSS